MKNVQSTDFVDRVEAKIRSLFLDGLPLTSDVCQYVEATLGAADPDTMAELLGRAGESESDTLLELVFFPDAVFQRRLETVLAGGGMAAGDHARLAERLKTAPAKAHLVFSHDPQRLACDLPIGGVDAFLSRLNLTWSIDARLRETLNQWGHKQTGKAETDLFDLMVKLRNAGLRQTSGQVRLLVDFLERMPPTDRRWGACFDFLMAFVSEHGETQNYYRALMARKMFILHHLMKARRHAETQARSNMETLRMIGFHPAHFDTVAAEQTLACIDAVARAVFGRTEHFDDAPASLDLGTVGDASDIEGIVRRLL